MQKKGRVLAFNKAEESVERQPRRCRQCDAISDIGFQFCSRCGAASDSIEKTKKHLLPRPGLVRRVLAELIDRLVPLPFIAYFFPEWIWAVVAYHIICDGTPKGQSVGKRICRLRVVSVTTREPCGLLRAMRRRLLTALGQAAYCAWVMIPIVLAWELASLAFVWINPAGRRLEDYLAGTQVITDNHYRRFHHVCADCGERLPERPSYCPRCGETN